MNRSNIGIVFLITIIFAVLLTIILIVASRSIYQSRSSIIYPPLIEGEFNYSCTNRPCGYGYICDPQFNLCRLDLGQPCQSSNDCITGSYCAGTCISKVIPPSAITGITGDNCPCNYNTHSCVNGICLSKTTCSIDQDCITTSCINGTCSGLFDNGTLCEYNAQCSSYNCSNGVCQMSGVVTGTIGSSCQFDCNYPLVCDNGICRLP